VHKIKNPNYKTDKVINAEKASAKLALYIGSLPNSQEFVTFDEIRSVVDSSGLSITSADLPDNLIEHIAISGGFDVEK
jgi:hypothetical protein